MTKSFSLSLVAGACWIPSAAPSQAPVYPPAADFKQTAGAEVSHSFASDIPRGQITAGR